LRAEIVLKRLLLISGLSLLSGCAWTVRQETDQTVRDMVEYPFDVAPQNAMEARKPPSEAPPSDRTSSTSRSGEKAAPDTRSHAVLLAGAPSRSRSGEKPALVPEVPTDVQTTALMESHRNPARPDAPLRDDRVLAAAWTQPPAGPSGSFAAQRKLDLEISPHLPGSEAPRIMLPRDPAAAEREIDRIYPELPPLPVEPPVQPGPEGKPYTLSDLQRMAAANSPTLRQAVSDVKAAEGNLIQAKTYPNPTLSYLVDPSNNNSTAGVQGGAIDQPIITGGKMKLGVAAAQKNLDNAILALKRARSDLATGVRSAYFTVLVDVETLVVTRALVQFSDDIYRLQTGILKGTIAAPYEPTALRAQTQINRLAYRQAIASYIYDWKALVATLGLPQLPLSEIAGQVDRFIPYYDYDAVRAHVLQNHTDILTAFNGVKIAQYQLKLAQVTPVFPNLDVRYSLEKDFALGPFGTYQTLALGFPLPIWDQNKGNIIAAQGALIRAGEESHRVEVTLTNNLALAYESYRNNLYSMEYYRRYILPDLVRYYRGVYARRQIDPNSAFGDLVFAQQNLATNVQAYLGILQSLWTSVANVADFLQTNDLYQLATPRALPELPDFRQPPPHWACGHDTLAASVANGSGASGPQLAAPVAGSPLARLAGGLPVPPDASGTGTPPPGAGAGTPSAPSQGVVPLAGPRPAEPSARAPATSDSDKEANRGGPGLIRPTVPLNSYFGEEDHHEGQNL
jgi:cobalt-zinc-cadmium efflux system outer membrane protein